jgi:N-dimethylarginine dimethylaminohydrolase
VVSPVSDELAVAFLPQLPCGLHELLLESGVEILPVPEDEMATQGCNILAVRPGVVVMVDGNPATRRALLDRGCEVHTFPGSEVCINGSGGPTCITRPILRG